MIKKLRLGSRGSKLALYQAELAKKRIITQFPGMVVDIVIIKTKGDKILDTALSKIGDKGLFTKELENSLLLNEIDAAVHSLKDIPSLIDKEFSLSAVLERADCRDALISKHHTKLNEISHNETIATSSLRRIAQLRHLNPEYTIVDIRGNIQTRLKKMEEGYCDAMILASAGLHRLQLEEYITEILDADIMIPAVGQGAIALESRNGDDRINNILAEISHQDTWLRIMAERAFMNKIEGGCQVPVGCFTSLQKNRISIKGFIASLNGKKYIQEKLTGSADDPESLGRLLAQKLLGRGGKEILDQIRS